MQSAADRFVGGYEITSLCGMTIRETHELAPTRMLQVECRSNGQRAAGPGPRPKGSGRQEARWLKQVPRGHAGRACPLSDQ